jgi:hypothetical protein
MRVSGGEAGPGVRVIKESLILQDIRLGIAKSHAINAMRGGTVAPVGPGRLEQLDSIATEQPELTWSESRQTRVNIAPEQQPLIDKPRRQETDERLCL